MPANNILTEELPHVLCGAEFSCDFKSIIRFFEIQESDYSQDEKGMMIQQVLFPNGAPDDKNLGKELSIFLAMGEEIKEDNEVKCFDFRIDAGRIFASFMQAYHIDLTKENFHWWIFLELFLALPEDTIIRKIIDIRTKKIDSKMSSKEKVETLRLQEKYSLDKTKSSADELLGSMFR